MCTYTLAVTLSRFNSGTPNAASANTPLTVKLHTRTSEGRFPSDERVMVRTVPGLATSGGLLLNEVVDVAMLSTPTQYPAVFSENVPVVQLTSIGPNGVNLSAQPSVHDEPEGVDAGQLPTVFADEGVMVGCKHGSGRHNAVTAL